MVDGDQQAEASRDQQTCFIISPFGGYHDRYISDVFEPAVRDAGLRPTKASDLFRSTNIVDDIWEFIAGASVVLVDMSGRNPNAFYELGLAHAASKPAVLVTDDIDDVPFDLRLLRALVYDVNQPDWGDQLRSGIKAALLETVAAPHNKVLPTFLRTTRPTGTAVTPEMKELRGLRQEIDSLTAQVVTMQGRDLSSATSHQNDSSRLLEFTSKLGLDPRQVDVGGNHYDLVVGIQPTDDQMATLREWAIANGCHIKVTTRGNPVMDFDGTALGTS
jgi:hypothetical protein